MLIRLTPLDGEAVLSLADAKDHLRVRHEDEDALISSLRDSAVSHIERVSTVVLSQAQFRWTMAGFPARVALPVSPVVAVTSIVRHDASGADQNFADYRLVSGAVVPAIGASWPSAYGYAAVNFTAGLTSPADAPPLLAAVKLKLSVLEDRGRSDPKVIEALETAITSLIDTYRPVPI